MRRLRYFWALSHTEIDAMQETVLLLDDDETMLGIVEGILSGAGFECVTCNDPLRAIDLIASRPDILVVLSDLLMPGVNGLQLADRLNALDVGRSRPRMLLLTAHPTLEAAVDALRLGVRDFLVKPVRAPELIEAVGRALSLAREDRAASASRPPQVEHLMRQAEELAGRLRNLAYVTETQEAKEPGGAPTTVHKVPPRARPAARPQVGKAPDDDGGTLAVLETIERLRRLRARYEHHKLDDTAWDLLLELLRAERLRQRMSVSGLAISAGTASATTSLRRVNELVARGYIERIPDPKDARRDFVALTSKSQELLGEYLSQAISYVSALTA